MRVYARDKGTPQKSAFIDVTIKINRLVGTLSFASQNYEETIDESRAVDTTVVQTRAAPGVSKHDTFIHRYYVRHSYTCKVLHTTFTGIAIA